MGLSLQFIISLVGLFTPHLQTTSVEYSIEGNGTFLEAQKVCRKMNGTLVTFASKAENDDIMSSLRHDGEHFWIGLYDNLSRWTWSLDYATFDNGLDFSSWGWTRSRDYNDSSPPPIKSEPELSVLAKICVLMYPDGLWYDEQCTVTHPAICYYDPGPVKYILLTVPMTWKKARDSCMHNYTDLASVRNLTENGNISTLLTEPSWIGLYRKGWAQWSDRTSRNFANFHNNNLARSQTSISQLNCARADTSTGLWSNVSCESNSSILCQFIVEDTAQTIGDASSSGSDPIGSPSEGESSGQDPEQHDAVDQMSSRRKNTVKLRLQSDTDLNEPHVQDGILEQLRGNLQDKRLADLKLHWIQADGKVFHEETTQTKNQDC